MRVALLRTVLSACQVRPARPSKAAGLRNGKPSSSLPQRRCRLSPQHRSPYQLDARPRGIAFTGESFSGRGARRKRGSRRVPLCVDDTGGAVDCLSKRTAAERKLVISPAGSRRRRRARASRSCVDRWEAPPDAAADEICRAGTGNEPRQPPATPCSTSGHRFASSKAGARSSRRGVSLFDSRNAPASHRQGRGPRCIVSRHARIGHADREAAQLTGEAERSGKVFGDRYHRRRTYLPPAGRQRAPVCARELPAPYSGVSRSGLARLLVDRRSPLTAPATWLLRAGWRLPAP